MSPFDRDAPVLNLERLAESAGGDASLMRELAQLYLRDTEQKLSGLEEAVRAGEAEHSGKMAHSIKGASAAVGAEQAAAAFRSLEQLGRSGETTGLEAALLAASAAYARARERLQKFAA